MAEVALLFAQHPMALAAELVANALRRCGPGARLGVSGGSALAALALLRQGLPVELWSALRLAWVDERLVPSSDLASNRGEAYRNGILSSQWPVAMELALVMDGESEQQALERALAQFRQDFGAALDVALLGMGEDGHIASLFPGHPALSSLTPIVCVADSPKPPPRRLTLSLPVLARPGLERIIVALGPGKRDALMRLIAGDPELPAARLGPVTVVTDQLELRPSYEGWQSRRP